MIEINLNTKKHVKKSQSFPNPPPPVYHRAQSTTSINTYHGNSSSSTLFNHQLSSSNNNNNNSITPKRPGDYYTAKLLKRRSDTSTSSTISHDNASLFSIPSSIHSSTTTISSQLSSPKFPVQRSFSVPVLQSNHSNNNNNNNNKPMLNRTKTRYITNIESKQREKLRKQTFDEEVDDDQISDDECSLILFNVPLHNDLISKNL